MSGPAMQQAVDSVTGSACQTAITCFNTERVPNRVMLQAFCWAHELCVTWQRVKNGSLLAGKPLGCPSELQGSNKLLGDMLQHDPAKQPRA